MSNQHDPLSAAIEDAERGNEIYGQIQLTASFVKLKKGQAKTAWVEGDDPRDRSTEINFTLNPIDEMGFTKLIQRSAISGNNNEFGKIIWPSLRDGCGMKDLRSVDNKFVRVEMVKNGRTWTDNKTGEVKEGTTLKFLAVYNSEKECKDAFFGNGHTARTPKTNDDGGAMDVDMSPSASTVNQELETAKLFLPALVKQSGGDKQRLAKSLSEMPPVGKYFTIESPEVKALLAA